MNKIVVYHGSDKIIKKPLLSLGKRNNDYGQGFYCTEDLELAKEWACRFDHKGYANKYELNLDSLNVLYINNLDNAILSWITILIKNRNFIKTPQQEEISHILINNYDIDLSSYDVVVGYRADDSYFSYAEDFLNNSLSFENLEKALRLDQLGLQVVLISEKAFSSLKYFGYQIADEKYHNQFLKRDQKARHDYAMMSAISEVDGTFVIDIIREKRKQ